MMGTNNIGVMKFMLPETSYQPLADELDDKSKAVILSALMEDKTQSSELENDFIKEIQKSIGGQATSLYLGIRY